MLVLARKPNEKLQLRNEETGEVITVTQVRIGRGEGRIGIDADQKWKIVREEILSKKTA